MSVINIKTARNAQTLGPNGFPLRVLVLECPYDTLLENPLTHQIYPKLLALKINGYKAVYPYGVLPMDTADFVANHIILAEETPDGFIPHTAFKSITLSRCKTHYLTFPAYHLFEITGQPVPPAYTDYLDRTIAEAESKNEEVGYNGSWTVSKDLQLMKDRFDFRKASAVFFACYYREYKIRHIIAAASEKYKVDRIKTFIGFDYFKSQDEKLSPINLVPYGAEPFYMMHLKQYTAEMLELCETPEYKNLWENRLTIQATPVQTQKKAA